MKLKTHKAMSKRLTVTKRGKIIKRAAGQDHFKSRQSGNKRRGIRRDVSLAPTHARAVETLIQVRTKKQN